MTASMITIALVLMAALTAHAANLRSDTETPPRRPNDPRGPASHTGEPPGPESPENYTYSPYAGALPAEGSSGRKIGTPHEIDLGLTKQPCMPAPWTYDAATTSCYKLMPEAATFSEASLACSQERVSCVNCPIAHIAVANTPEEAAVIHTIAGETVWMGYHFGGYSNSAYPDYEWADYIGAAPALDASASGEGVLPFSGDSPRSDLACVKMTAGTGAMQAIDCGESKKYVCEAASISR